MFKILRVLLCFFVFALIIRTPINDQCVDPYQTAPHVKLYTQVHIEMKDRVPELFKDFILPGFSFTDGLLI